MSDTEQEEINTMITTRLSAFENSSLEEQHEYRLAQKIRYVRDTDDSPQRRKEIAQMIFEYKGGSVWAGVMLADAGLRELLSLS